MIQNIIRRSVVPDRDDQLVLQRFQTKLGKGGVGMIEKIFARVPLEHDLSKKLPAETQKWMRQTSLDADTYLWRVSL